MSFKCDKLLISNSLYDKEGKVTKFELWCSQRSKKNLEVCALSLSILRDSD